MNELYFCNWGVQLCNCGVNAQNVEKELLFGPNCANTLTTFWIFPLPSPTTHENFCQFSIFENFCIFLGEYLMRRDCSNFHPSFNYCIVHCFLDHTQAKYILIRFPPCLVFQTIFMFSNKTKWYNPRIYEEI